MTYCTECGSKVEVGLRFCTGCGNPVSPPDVPTGAEAAGSLPFQAQPTPPSHVAQAVGSSKAGCGKIAFIAAAVLVLVIALGVGGGFYAYRSIKQKINSVVHGSNSLGATNPQRDASSSVAPSSPAPASSTDGFRSPSSRAASDAAEVTPAAFPAWQPGPQESKTPAPLRQGMLVVTAVADASGDYESFKEVSAIDSRGISLSYKSEHPKTSATTPSPSTDTITSRTVLTQDLNASHDYAEVFSSNDPSSFPGTTAISASREVLAELKQTGTTHFSFRPDGLKGAISSVVNVLSGIAGIDPKSIGDGSLAKASKEECSLRRDGADFAFPVLLNDQPVNLPALRARCRTDDGPADFFILDQDDYPLMLSWKLGEGSQLQVIKITYPHEPTKIETPPRMEADLAEKKKVEIYGIYFDFASDYLQPESKPVLDEIAQIMKKHTNWKLSVRGHTDNIGGDAYNLDLSKRRAAAVKMALVTRYNIAPDRLTNDGYGASSPIDTNNTMQGRARNRRVELTRE